MKKPEKHEQLKNGLQKSQSASDEEFVEGNSFLVQLSAQQLIFSCTLFNPKIGLTATRNSMKDNICAINFTN